jgi:hypothetical protein
LRYIAVQYLPHVNYATLLDWYIQASLFFILAGVCEVVFSFSMFYAPIENSYTYIISPTRAEPQPGPKVKDHSWFDNWAWGALAVGWLLVNIKFILLYTAQYVRFQSITQQLEDRKERRRCFVNGVPLRAKKEPWFWSWEELKSHGEVVWNYVTQPKLPVRACSFIWGLLFFFFQKVRELLGALLYLVDAFLCFRCFTGLCFRCKKAHDHNKRKADKEDKAERASARFFNVRCGFRFCVSQPSFFLTPPPPPPPSFL